MDLDGIDDFAGTSDKPNFDPGLNMSARVALSLNDWTSGVDQILMAQWAAATGAFRFYVTGAGFLALEWKQTDGTIIVATSTEVIPVLDGEFLSVRADLYLGTVGSPGGGGGGGGGGGEGYQDIYGDIYGEDAGGGNGNGGTQPVPASPYVVVFRTKAVSCHSIIRQLTVHGTCGVCGPSRTGSVAQWQVLGDTVSGTEVTNIFDTNIDLTVGADSEGNSEATGKVLGAVLFVDGERVASPDFSAQAPGLVTFIDEELNTWTGQGDASIESAELGICSSRARVVDKTLSCGCPVFPEEFVDPETDEAPWFDSDIPQSSEFLGVFAVPDFPTVLRRSVTEYVNGGGSVGPLRPTPRIIEFTGSMFASSSEGMAYGQRWLEEVLSGQMCKEDCAADEAQVLPACEAGFRHTRNTGIADGPVFGEPRGQTCVVQEVDFQLIAGVPYLFGESSTLLNEATPFEDVDCALIVAREWTGDVATVITFDAEADRPSKVRVTARPALAEDGCPDEGSNPCAQYEVDILGGHRVIVDSASRTVTEYSRQTEEVKSGVPRLTILNGGPFVDVEPCARVCYCVETIGEPGALVLPELPNSTASTPNDPSFDVLGTDTMAVAVAIKPNVFPPALDRYALVSKWQSPFQESWRLELRGEAAAEAAADGRSPGFLTFAWSNDGTGTTNGFDSEYVKGLEDGQALGVMAAFSPSVSGFQFHSLQFYTRTIDLTDPLGSLLDLSGWQQLGDTQVRPGATNIFAGVAPVVVGDLFGASDDEPFGGLAYAAVVFGDMDVPVATPDFSIHTDGTPSFVDSTGKTWTVNGSAMLRAASSPNVKIQSFAREL